MLTDLHTHLWPAAFVATLRARRRSPRLDGWTLELADGTWAVDPAAHDVDARAAQADADGLDVVCVSPSAALGLDRLPAAEAAELAAAWLDGALDLPAPFRAWATAGVIDPDPAALQDGLDRGAIGLELAADVLAAPDALDRLAPLLDVLDAARAPLFVHPGPAAPFATPGPAAATPGPAAATRDPAATPPPTARRARTWTAVVDDVAGLHAAWWAWVDGGRERYPDLPVCFAALAGLALLHGERHRALGGRGGAVDPLTFVETSSYGPRAVDAVIRVLGVDVVCHGSGRPDTTPAPLRLDPSATYAIGRSNPARLLTHALQEVRT